MLPNPSKLKKLITVDTDWNNWTKSSGVYFISNVGTINRIFGKDDSGLLYIGKAKVLRDRVHQFIRSDHNISWFLYKRFLYKNRDLAKKYLDTEIPDEETKLLPFFGKLNIRYIECGSESEAEKIERIAVFSYVKLFGEVPPLNSSIPDKYNESNEPPNLEEIKWFEKISQNA